MVSLSRIYNFSNPLVLFITEKPSKCYFFYYKLCLVSKFSMLIINLSRVDNYAITYATPTPYNTPTSK